MIAFKRRWNRNQKASAPPAWCWRSGIPLNGRFHHAVEIGLHNMNFATVNGFHRAR
jgi:hypothetical protein